jgi:hypothetical protein
VLNKFFTWIDEWWAHKLHLPGGRAICDAFDRYLMGDETRWDD